MSKVYLLCSSNWTPAGPDARTLLTMVNFLRSKHLVLTRLALITGDQPEDLKYCGYVIDQLTDLGLSPSVCTTRDDGTPEQIAVAISRAAEEAAETGAELWVDLTPGPKHRAAVFFAAASAINGVKIFYSERTISGDFEPRELQKLESYNPWLGRHGLQFRNYCEELKPLASRFGVVECESVMQAVLDLLGSRVDFEHVPLSVSSNLLPFAEKICKAEVPRELFSKTTITDNDIKSAWEEWRSSAGRASQTAWLLRNLFAHGDRSKDSAKRAAPRKLDIHDALMFLDCLSYLSTRLNALTNRNTNAEDFQPESERIFIAVDGDDVGRRFEERLAECLNTEDALDLRNWSEKIQRDLSELMIQLINEWDGIFIARTGDGFLASISSLHLHALTETFRPKLLDETVTTGIGGSVKAAYLALKLGKARNRGGGTLFSFDPPKEELLWRAGEGNA